MTLTHTVRAFNFRIVIALYYALISRMAVSYFFSATPTLFYVPNFLIRTWQQCTLPTASWEWVLRVLVIDGKEIKIRATL
jgi:hypothetical protein